jgi:hypothetical protein
LTEIGHLLSWQRTISGNPTVTRGSAWMGRVVVTAIASIWFFRQQIHNRFTILFDDPDDSVITTSLIEH